MEFFTALYSNIPEHVSHFRFLYIGLDGNTTLVPWMWTSALLSVVALVMLLIPKLRKNESILALACLAVFFGIWIDKGLGMIVAGFVPSPMGVAIGYSPTAPEVFISLAVYALGAFLVTVLYKIAVSVRARLAA